jgi:probable rRNA maturation factor
VRREAEDQTTPFAHHVQHLVVHGILHLLGFDHETAADAERMEALEIGILAGLSIANPYTGELDAATKE